MRFNQQEKMEVINLVENSDLSANRTLKELGIHKRTYYNWYSRYIADGLDGIAPAKARRQVWNKIPPKQKNQVVKEALEHESLSCRELATHIVDKHKWFISESSVYRILKDRGLITAPAHIVLSAANEYTTKTFRINEMWQTDFTYFLIKGWGWYYLSTILDDFSRRIITFRLCESMSTPDAMDTVNDALVVTGLSRNQRPRLLSDNGPCFISGEFRKYLSSAGIKQINGKPCHPQTQGKIERYHRSMKNIIKLDNYFSPDDLREAIAKFVDFYNNERYHESLNNLTPADVYFGRSDRILEQRRKVKERTLKERRRNYLTEKLLLT